MEIFDGYSKHDFEEFHRTMKAKFVARKFNPRVATDEDATAWEQLTNYLFYLPDLLLLAVNLTFDGDCAAEKKDELYEAIKYVVYSIDMIPDAIPDAGWVDDLVMVSIALYNFINAGDEEEAVAQKHWTGDSDVVDIVSQLLGVAYGAINYLPKELMRRVIHALHQNMDE